MKNALNYFLYPKCEFSKNWCRGRISFFAILYSKFALWVNFNPTLWVAKGVWWANPSKWQLMVASGPI